MTHTSTGASDTLTGGAGSVSCGVTDPFPWVLVCTRFCLCLLKVFHDTGCSGLVHWDDPEGGDGEGFGRGVQDG